MVEFFVAMAIVGILGVVPIVLMSIYSNYKQGQIKYKNKITYDEIEDAAFRVENYVNGKDGLWMLKRHNRSTPSRCLGLDIGLACGYTLYF